MHTAIAHLIGAALLLVSASTAQADDIADTEAVISPEDFIARMIGKTALFKDANGDQFGAESYFEDGSSIWQRPDGTCEHGDWRVLGGYICFHYGQVSCWQLFENDDAIHAVSKDGFRLDLERAKKGTLSCEPLFSSNSKRPGEQRHKPLSLTSA